MTEKEQQEQATSAAATGVDVGAANDDVANSSTDESINDAVETGKAVDLQ